jgi:hypothetical protein
MFVKKALSLVVGAICLQASMASFAADNAPSIEELWDIVQRQQTELEALKAKLEATRSQTRSVQVQSLENSQHLEVVAEAMEQPGAIGGSNWTDRTTIGGYGEMLYNDETSSASSKELDVQRFVLFASHEFNANLRFFSELEIEHSLIEDGAPGAVELEQAYIEWDYARNHSVLAGMHLVPMGILNETHEPNTFYGVERNRIESRIIPSTYRVNGIKFAGQLGSGFSYDLGLHEGLFFESGNGGDLALRSSRQSGARAEMDSPAYTGRLRYTGVPGLELGISAQYQTDMTQNGSTRGNIGREGVIDMLGNPVDGLSGLLTEAHVIYKTGPWGFTALFAEWDIDSKIESIANNDLSNNGLGRDSQYGYYLQPSYQLNAKLGTFLRYERTDERAGSNLGAAHDSATSRTITGFNYWLADNVVVKFDYQFEDDGINRDLDGFNLGVGWQF